MHVLVRIPVFSMFFPLYNSKLFLKNLNKCRLCSSSASRGFAGDPKDVLDGPNVMLGFVVTSKLSLTSFFVLSWNENQSTVTVDNHTLADTIHWR